MKGRTPNHIRGEEVTEVILKMIEAHRGKPCPTRREIVEWTGLPRRDVWPFLKSLAGREPPLIEIEERLHRRAGLRRLRRIGGEWTGWTERKTPSQDDHAVLRRLKREAFKNGQC
jgi:hypothetical protein